MASTDEVVYDCSPELVTHLQLMSNDPITRSANNDGEQISLPVFELIRVSDGVKLPITLETESFENFTQTPQSKLYRIAVRLDGSPDDRRLIVVIPAAAICILVNIDPPAEADASE